MIPLIITLVVILITSFGLLYLKFVYDSYYWKRRGIPGPYHLKTNSIENQANILFDQRNPNVLILRDWTKEYGPVYGYNEGQRKILVVSDPEIAHEVMVKKFDHFHGRKLNPIVGNVETEARVHVFNAKGSRWKRLRSTSSPCFTVANLKKMLPTIIDCSNVTMAFLDKACESGKPFNIHPYFHEYTMDVISRIALGEKDKQQFTNSHTEMVKEVIFKFANNPIDYWAFVFPKLGPILRKVLFNLGKFKKIPIKDMFDTLYAKVDERKEERANESSTNQAEASIDFIDLFLDAEDNSIVDGSFEKTNMKVSKKLTSEEITGQCFVFVLAGFDTTANTLAVTSWFLAKYPEIQDKLLEEIDEIFGNDDEVTLEKLNAMRYSDAVMKEALRHYPVAAFAASRECQIPTTLGPSKIEIEKEVCVALDLFTLHFDKSVWGNDAEEFKPERFFETTPKQLMSFYPFGGGNRLCLGIRLAYLEQKLALFKILRKYRIRECSETEKNLKMVGTTILNPDSVTVMLEKRL